MLIITARPPAGATRLATRFCVLWAVLALVCMQALGLVHQVVHEGGAGTARHVEHAHHHGAAPDRQHSFGPAQGEWLKALFDPHEDAADCRLYDGVGPNGLPCPAAPALGPMTLASLPLLAAGDGFMARWVALFHARGPPSSR